MPGDNRGEHPRQTEEDEGCGPKRVGYRIRGNHEKIARQYLQELFNRYGHGPLFFSEEPTCISKTKYDCLRDNGQNWMGVAQQYEVLAYYKNRLPPQLIARREIMTREEPDCQMVLSQECENLDGDPVDLPKHYFKPWPFRAHKLCFPRIRKDDVTELAVVCLSEYKTHLQSDDSCEIGLRIIGYIHRNMTDVCILPAPGVWSFFNRTVRDPFIIDHVIEDGYLQDIQRKLCSYMPVTIGCTPCSKTMFVHREHWYVLLLSECEALMKVVVECLNECFEDACCLRCEDNMSLNGMEALYRESLKSRGKLVQNLMLCIQDSLWRPLTLSGWE